MIYLDNAATSFPKPRIVIKEVERCLKKYCGNPGRSGHRLSLAAAESIYETREEICKLVSLSSPDSVCFTQNATHALNIAIKGIIRDDGDCLISDLEHNSVIRPLYKQKQIYGGNILVFRTDIPLRQAISGVITDRTKYMVSTLSSNVTGKVIDIKELSSIARENNLKLILDASQYIGHHPLDLSGVAFDALCAPGHKALFGIQGSGFLIIGNQASEIPTLIEGGSGSGSLDTAMPLLSPERFEAGTLSTPSIISMRYGIKYIESIGQTEIENKIRFLTQTLLDRLSNIKKIQLIGCENGICALNVYGQSSETVSAYLDSCGICVRGGLHCSPLIHRRLGTASSGAVRVSLSVLNTKKDIDKLYQALSSI